LTLVRPPSLVRALFPPGGETPHSLANDLLKLSLPPHPLKGFLCPLPALLLIHAEAKGLKNAVVLLQRWKRLEGRRE
jgi:hypothetical protein